MAVQTQPLLEIKNLKKHFPIQRGLLRRTVGHVKAVDGIDLHIDEGETLGLVGESGCGKTTTGRCILRVLEPTEGEILFTVDCVTVSITELGRREMRYFRRNIQMIFQDPFSSLNPRMTMLDIIGEPLLVQGIAKGEELEDRVREVLDSVGLSVEHLRRYPHSFSGGQRQRISIARALLPSPKLIVADEPVSALDVSIQAQVINLLQDLQQELRLTYLFIAHNMTVVRHISNRIAVMYLGKVVELAPTEEVINNPKHPYTESLLEAIPRPDPHYVRRGTIMSGEAPDPANPPSGCVFRTRCRFSQEICSAEEPKLLEVKPGHFAGCHFADTLELRGVGR